MRIVFFGVVDFSLHCLQQTLQCSGDVVAVFTLARRNAGFHSDYADLSQVADPAAIPVHAVENINNPRAVEMIRAYEPDVIFAFGWSQIVSREIREIPPMGCIGTHPALLPRNRGRHPIVWALVEGLKESGLTFFYLEQKADSGDILWQKPFSITLEDDARSVYGKIKDLAGLAIADFLPKLEAGTAPRRPQDHSQATYWRKRTQADGEIHWSESSMKVYNLIRALSRPYVGSHTILDGRRLSIWKAALPGGLLPQTAACLAPGTVFSIRGGTFDVRTGDGHLTILEWESDVGVQVDVGSQLGVGIPVEAIAGKKGIA